MSFFNHRKVDKNYDLLSACAWYTPGVSGLFAVLGWFLVGLILAALVTMPMMFGGTVDLSYVMLILYPLQFLPLLIFVRLQSSKNSYFDRGYKLDSNHFGKMGGAGLAVFVAVGILAAGMILEAVNHFLPDTEGSMIEQMERMMEGPLWVNFLTMCIFAPLLEEWMCRGVILRGLLNYEHKGGEVSQRPRGMNPALAIVISAFFFAAIHGNVWQGVTAFLIGCLMGYVYYRTGSLKLTILMHFTNNTFAVLTQKFGGESLKEAKSLLDVMPLWEYAIIFIVSAVIVFMLVRYLSTIRLQDPQGNCDIIPSADEQAAAEQVSSDRD